MWRALRANPSLDARWAMQVIDRLLDQRPRQGQPAALEWEADISGAS